MYLGVDNVYTERLSVTFRVGPLNAFKLSYRVTINTNKLTNKQPLQINNLSYQTSLPFNQMTAATNMTASLQGCDALFWGEWLPTFRMNLLPFPAVSRTSRSTLWAAWPRSWRHVYRPKCGAVTTQQHSVRSQKNRIFSKTAVRASNVALRQKLIQIEFADMSGTVGGARRKVFTVRAWNSHSAVIVRQALPSAIWTLQVILHVKVPVAQLSVGPC
jgi:hypothetical protein